MADNRFALEKNIQDTKVVVAMSGGVDSSVVAAMLHDEGYQVIGITMQLYDHGLALAKKGACCAGRDIYDAKEVAANLNIPHYVFNYENIFKEEVIEDFADSYLRGETPIPCVKCNQSVKFRDMFKTAKDLNADALVTGHYVQKIINDSGEAELHRGSDHSKDQSYFLFATTKSQLDYIHFPLGSLNKTQTRELARKYKLKVADKADSQDICFVPNGSYASVIEKFRPGALDKGDIVHTNGTVLGHHNGIINYTVGQRRGLGIAWKSPLYVIKIDQETNRVIVGEEYELNRSSFYIKDTNWLGDETSKESKSIDLHVKLRSLHNPIGAKLQFTSHNRAKITLDQAEKAITPGQACVFYQGERVLGGGWIEKEA